MFVSKRSSLMKNNGVTGAGLYCNLIEYIEDDLY